VVYILQVSWKKLQLYRLHVGFSECVPDILAIFDETSTSTLFFFDSWDEQIV
jgi:hypothetical protein